MGSLGGAEATHVAGNLYVRHLTDEVEVISRGGAARYARRDHFKRGGKVGAISWGKQAGKPVVIGLTACQNVPTLAPSEGRGQRFKSSWVRHSP